MIGKERPSWDEYFMRFASLAACRSSCVRRSVGAVIVRDRQVLATGYNGPPRGYPHGCDAGCRRDLLGIPSGEQPEILCCVHAEQNAIIQAARHGTRIDGAEMYTTHRPCDQCTRMIINAGIVRVYYANDYGSASTSVDDPVLLDLIHITTRKDT